MDIISLIDSHGLPISIAVVLGIAVFKLISYILIAQDTKLESYNEHIVGEFNELTKHLTDEFSELEEILKKDYSRIEGIIIKLIDQQKAMQIDLAELESAVKILVDFLQTERDLEKERLLSKLSNKKGANNG